jgi:ABC-2 type transport system ATP-binding protein
MAEGLAIDAESVVKSYGATVALADFSLAVPAGSIQGVLGPNGAGKTTAVRVLTTLARPDAGRARVAGLDVTSQSRKVRRRIGVAAQDATLDELLTGRQNLEMIGRLAGLRARQARHRSAELLEEFGLTEAGGRVVQGYSGGMRRRLDLAASMLTRPEVLFLDEPTTGLDPASRQRVWEEIRELTATGVTLLLTTQYLEEADRLADRIAVVDHGRVIAEDTAEHLKQAVGGARLQVTLAEPHPEALDALAPHIIGQPHLSADRRRIQATVDPQAGLATTIIRALDRRRVAVDDIEVAQPSLDDVFFTLTGHDAENGTGKSESEEVEAISA